MNRPFSLRSGNRLKKKSDIEAVYRQGRILRASYFRAYCLPSAVSRLGISVSSRFGNAVFRNHVKRSVREVFRYVKSELAAPLDIIITLSKNPPDGAAGMSDLKRIFKCLKEIKPSSES
jgi:ribonuclease P protein component